jgi:putative ABC transport system ATP-binding protein
MPILEVKGLKKTYTTRLGGSRVEALKNVNFSVERGEYIAIMGESGSGKTTLLNILAALDKPTVGSVILDGKDLSKIKESALASFRRDNLGFVFQDFNLLDTFTLKDNNSPAPCSQRSKLQEYVLKAPTNIPEIGYCKPT